MTWAVWAPLLAPLLAVPCARRLADRLPPSLAALLLAATAALSGLLATGSLALLTAAGLLRIPFVAALGHLSAPQMRQGDPIALPVDAFAGLALVAALAAVLRAVRRHRADLVHASGVIQRLGAAGDLTVLPDPAADAYALPGLPGRPGRVVVTAGMLRHLDAREREVLLAHERAHLRCRHHLLIICADLAGRLHPVLRALRAPLAFHLERWADESAARVVGDRRLTARAVGRAALATTAAPPGRRPATALAAAAGPVPRRVAALLAAAEAAEAAAADAQPRHRPRHRPHGAGWSRRTRGRGRGVPLVGGLLAASLLLSGWSALEAASDLHATIEWAQGCASAHPDSVYTHVDD